MWTTSYEQGYGCPLFQCWSQSSAIWLDGMQWMFPINWIGLNANSYLLLWGLGLTKFGSWTLYYFDLWLIHENIMYQTIKVICPLFQSLLCHVLTTYWGHGVCFVQVEYLPAKQPNKVLPMVGWFLLFCRHNYNFGTRHVQQLYSAIELSCLGQQPFEIFNCKRMLLPQSSL
jgi:hypothetical protein